jgi:hypothetical protein
MCSAMRAALIAVFGALVPAAIVGCATRTMMITSNPDHAAVSINGNLIGDTPIKYTFDYGQRTYYDVVVRKPGYLDVSRQMIGDTEGANRDKLAFDLPPDPAYKETTASEAANQWLRVQVPPRITRESMWQTLVDAVTSRYSNIEQMDPSSGYIRSAPITKTYSNPVHGEYSIRTEFVGSTVSTDPLVYKMKIQSEYCDHPNQWIPFNRIFAADQQLIEELQNRLGLK